MNETVKEWLDKAQGDFDSAEALLTLDKASTYDTICFSCQQCIEKMLKAALIHIQQKPPKTHNLSKLGSTLLQYKSDWSVELDNLGFLTQFAIEFRYPGYKADRLQAEEAFKVCVVLKESILKLFIE